MAIHKTRYRPPVYVNGEATYPDIVYFETSADMVKVTDEDELYDATDVEAALAEVKTELDEHKSDYVEEVGTVANLATTSKVVVGAINELNTNKANKVQEDWITPTLLNGATGNLQYRMNIFGRVEFKGELTAPTQGVFFVLPIKYRPLSPVLGIIPERPTGTTTRRVAMTDSSTGFYVYGSSENAMSLGNFSYVGRGE